MKTDWYVIPSVLLSRPCLRSNGHLRPKPHECIETGQERNEEWLCAGFVRVLAESVKKNREE